VIELKIPVSPDQEDVIADYILEGGELGMVPDERAWMLAHARKIYPGCKILAADLNIEDVQWTLSLELRANVTST